MRMIVKQPDKRKSKRDVFAELTEGIAALAESRGGKRTLRTHAEEFKSAPTVTPQELIRVRESLNMSRAGGHPPARSTSVFLPPGYSGAVPPGYLVQRPTTVG